MNAQIRTWLACTTLAAACQAIALAWPGAPAGAALPRWLALAVAEAGLALAVTAARSAWRARQWQPAFVALACASVALGAACGATYTAIAPSPSVAAASGMPLLGLLLAGGWLFLSVQTMIPAGPARASHVRAVIAGGMALPLACGMVLALAPPVAPAGDAARLLAGLTAPACLYAGYRWAAVWHLLRLPSLLIVAAAAFALAPLAMTAAAGIPADASALFVLVAAIFAAALAVEQRARPGLRTIALGPPLRAAINALLRGDPRTMSALAGEIAAYDGAMRGHGERVAELSAHLALGLGLDAAAVREVMLASRLRDAGKLYVSQEILSKGKLAAPEEGLLRSHATLGAQMLARAGVPAAVVEAVRQHHERWAGGGFPDGASGERIARAARIIAVADAYAALRSARAYKREWGVGEALSEIERRAGSDFEPRVAYTLLRLVANGAVASQQPLAVAA